MALGPRIHVGIGHGDTPRRVRAPPCLRSLRRFQRGRAQQPARCGRGRPLRLRAHAAFVGLADAGAATVWPRRAEQDLKQRRRARRWTSRRCGRWFAVPEERLSPARRPVWRRRHARCDSHSRLCVPVTCGHAWQEWMKATPSRRPDIFPEFKPLKPQLPQPMPGDPEVPNDEEEADEKRQKVRERAGCGVRAQAVIQRPVTSIGRVALWPPFWCAPLPRLHVLTRVMWFSLESRQTRRTPTRRTQTSPNNPRRRRRSQRSRSRSELRLPEALWVWVGVRDTC
jgi:hypothetical protein